tara:strand:- start:1287 stop:3119 length:1833 start_codon:yes stop_codon:yes gene_type:complete
MAYTAGFSVSVGDPTKASDVTTLAANDDYLKAAVDGKAALSGSTNNTVATVTGANALIGEADLTFASNKLTVFGTTGTGTATAGVLNLSTRELTVVDADQLGRIEFQAPAETGSDAVLVAASIYAEADGTFSATVNATDLVLATAHDGAAAERVRITSQGEIGLAGANYGTDGQVLTSAGAGAAAAWEAIPPGTTLSGSTPHTVATVTGANALEGEANLTFDGSVLAVTGAVTMANAAGPTIVNEAATATNPTLIPNKGDDNTGFGWATTDSLTAITGGAERVRIDGAGTLCVGGGAPTRGGLFEIQGANVYQYLDASQHVGIQLDRGSTSYDSGLSFQTAATTNWRLAQMSADNLLQVWDDINEAAVMSFVQGGNVGVGTTSPDHHFESERTGGSADVFAGNFKDTAAAYQIQAHGTTGNVTGTQIASYMESSSPADGDFAGQYVALYKDAGGSKIVAGTLGWYMDDVTAGTIDTRMEFVTYNNNSRTAAFLTNAGVWTDASAAAGKEYFGTRQEVWPDGILASLKTLNVSKYKPANQPEDKPVTETHVSPTAEDFWDALQIGQDPRSEKLNKDGENTNSPVIAAKDLGGVALVAIQELLERVEALESA